jgi:uncharacterized protein YwlG (UPF0340 family)
VLRFLEQRDYDEVANILGVSREAAKQRVFRAVEKLRARLGGKGVAVSAAALAAVIGAHGVEAAPAGLAGSISAAAAVGMAGSSVAASGIAKGAMTMIAYTKMKAAVLVAAVALTIGGSATVVGMKVARAQAPAAAAPNGPTPPVVAVADAPVKPQAASGEAAGAPAADWFTRFHAVYGLEAGQLVKRVPPPFIAERWGFWKSQQPRIKPLAPGEPMMEKMFVIEWDGRRYQWKLASLGDGDLTEALRWAGGVKRVEVVGDEKLTRMSLPGDWVYRKGASVDDRVAAIAALLRKETGQRITIRATRQEREVVVVRGAFKPAGAVDDSGRPIVEFGLGEPVKPEPGAFVEQPMAVTAPVLFAEIENWFELPVVDESGSELTRLMMKRTSGDTKGKPNSAWLDTTLGSLAKQTGLEFERERREMAVWEVAVEK